MNGAAYYNENEAHAAQWLRNLIAAGLIAPGDVDERSIVDVRPDDLRGYDQCHFFAGIGVWSYALRNAGWPDGRKVWTGSCPCQPLSAAGAGKGFADERHLWPDWFWLIEQCRPVAIFGEQVASPLGLAWFDLVQTDLEGTGYAFGGNDICVAGFGAPHIRQRLFWMAYAASSGSGAGLCDNRQAKQRRSIPSDDSSLSALADTGNAERRQDAGGRKTAVGQTVGWNEGADHLGKFGTIGDLAYAAIAGRSAQPQRTDRTDGRASPQSGRLRDLSGEHAGPTNGFWRDADWLKCRDGKWRPVEPGTFPLVDGASFKLGSGGTFEGKSRTGMLRGYGNAINHEVATEFISAAMMVMP